MIEPSDAVEAYLQTFTGDARKRLDEVRKIVRECAPDATESYAYGLVGYKYNKKPLVYFGGFAHHTGFYATPNGHEAFKKEFAPYKQGKGSVQFPHDKPLPLALIAKVVEYRISQCQK